MEQLIDIPAIFSKVPTDTIDVKKYDTHKSNCYKAPLYRYAKNYGLNGLEYSLIMLSENGDITVVEKFLDKTSKNIDRKDIVSAHSKKSKMEYTNSKFGGNK